jgi:predicted RNase H-like HicB family nuclease
MTTMAARGRIYIEVFWDEDTERWDYAVPELHIVGAGGETREEARTRAAEAIAFALEARPEDRPGSEIVSLPVAVG